LFGGFGAHDGWRFIGRGDAAFFDTGAFSDPLVGGIDEGFKFVVGEDAGGEIDAGGEDGGVHGGVGDDGRGKGRLGQAWVLWWIFFDAELGKEANEEGEVGNEVSKAGVWGERRRFRDGDFGGEDAFDFYVAAFRVGEFVGDSACGGDDGGDAGVGGADHGGAEFDGAEDAVGEVLEGAGGVFEPAVVGEVDEEVGTHGGIAADKRGDDVFKAYEWGEAKGALLCEQDFEFGAGFEVLGIGDEVAEEGEDRGKGGVFAE
jgi:hypothetical protein